MACNLVNLKLNDVKSGNLVERGSNHGFEGAEDDPDGRGDEGEAGKVDVVVDGVQHGGQQEL